MFEVRNERDLWNHWFHGGKAGGRRNVSSFFCGLLGGHLRWRRLHYARALWYSLLGGAEPENSIRDLKNYRNPAKICSLVQWMQFPALDVPKEWVSGKKKDSLMETEFCPCFPEHLLSTLLVWETRPELPSCAAAPVPRVSFPDDNPSRVLAATAEICFQPSHVLGLLPPASLHQQLADLC